MLGGVDDVLAHRRPGPEARLQGLADHQPVGADLLERGGVVPAAEDGQVTRDQVVGLDVQAWDGEEVLVVVGHLLGRGDGLLVARTATTPAVIDGVEDERAAPDPAGLVDVADVGGVGLLRVSGLRAAEQRRDLTGLSAAGDVVAHADADLLRRDPLRLEPERRELGARLERDDGTRPGRVTRNGRRAPARGRRLPGRGRPSAHRSRLGCGGGSRRPRGGAACDGTARVTLPRGQRARRPVAVGVVDLPHRGDRGHEQAHGGHREDALPPVRVKRFHQPAHRATSRYVTGVTRRLARTLI